MALAFLNGFKKGFLDFGKYITNIVNAILLTIAYFFGIGISSAFAKIKRKQFLDRSIDKKKKSYWKDYNLKKESEDKYYKQF